MTYTADDSISITPDRKYRSEDCNHATIFNRLAVRYFPEELANMSAPAFQCVIAFVENHGADRLRRRQRSFPIGD